MTNWNNSRKRLKIFTKEFWKEYKWQDILINLLIYFAVFSSLLLIDLLTKWGLYIGDKPNEIIANYKILGIRSLLHRGTTLEIGLTLHGLHIITFLIIISTILFSALAKKNIIVDELQDLQLLLQAQWAIWLIDLFLKVLGMCFFYHLPI